MHRRQTISIYTAFSGTILSFLFPGKGRLRGAEADELRRYRPRYALNALWAKSDLQTVI